MRQPCAVKVAFPQSEHLSLGLQATKRGAVNDACAIALILTVVAGAVEPTVLPIGPIRTAFQPDTQKSLLRSRKLRQQRVYQFG